MDFSMAYLVNFYWAQIFSRKNPKYKMVNRWRIYNRTVNNLLETVNPEPLFLSWPNLTRFYLVKRENVFAPEMSEKFHFSELFENSYFREHPWTPFTLDISKKSNFWKIYILNMHFLSCKFILYILLYNSFYYFLQNHLKLEQETNKKHMQHSPPLIFLINQSNSKIEIKWY